MVVTDPNGLVKVVVVEEEEEEEEELEEELAGEVEVVVELVV